MASSSCSSSSAPSSPPTCGSSSNRFELFNTVSGSITHCANANSNFHHQQQQQQQQQQYLANGWMDDTQWAPPQHPTIGLHSLCNNNNNHSTSLMDYYGHCEPSSYGSLYRNDQKQQREVTVVSSNDCYKRVDGPKHCSSVDNDLLADYVHAPNGIVCSEQQLSPPLKLARPGPIECLMSTQCQRQQQTERRQIQRAHLLGRVEMPTKIGGPAERGGGEGTAQSQMLLSSDNIGEQSPSECQLVVVRQPEEQHRARYASEGSRGALKDRSGTSFCTFQLLGHYRPTRVELFAAQRMEDGHTFVEHNLYRLVPVAGKSATTTPCRPIITEEGTGRLEVMLRPENGMVVVLDCVGIMKICAYGANANSPPNCVRKCAANSRHRRRTKGRANGEGKAKDGGCGDGMTELPQKQTERCQNDVHIVAQVELPGRRQLRTHTEAIRCVQQLGCPDVLKMSLHEASSSGGQQLFIIGRNFNPKNLRVLFREYNNDGSLGWSAEAKLVQRLVHQCHIVCVVPVYHHLHKNALVSVTVICGPKQSHPINFTYTACVSGRGSDDDDWRPPDCATAAPAILNAYSQHNFVPNGTYSFGSFNQHIAYGNQNLRQKFATVRSTTDTSTDGNFF